MLVTWGFLLAAVAFVPFFGCGADAWGRPARAFRPATGYAGTAAPRSASGAAARRHCRPQGPGGRRRDRQPDCPGAGTDHGRSAVRSRRSSPTRLAHSSSPRCHRAPYSVTVEKSTYLTGRVPGSQSIDAGRGCSRSSFATGRSSRSRRPDVSRRRNRRARGRRPRRSRRSCTSARAACAPRRPPRCGGTSADKRPRRVPRAAAATRPLCRCKCGHRCSRRSTFRTRPSSNRRCRSRCRPTIRTPQSLAQAQSITVGRGETIAGVDMTLAEGDAHARHGYRSQKRRRSWSAAESSARASLVRSLHSDSTVVAAPGIRPGGTFRLMLSPGEYTLEAQVATRQGPGRWTERAALRQQPGHRRRARIEAVTIMVGRGRDRVRQASCSKARRRLRQAPVRRGFRSTIPMGPAAGRGRSTVAADWTFKIEGLSGTCGAPPHRCSGAGRSRR